MVRVIPCKHNLADCDCKEHLVSASSHGYQVINWPWDVPRGRPHTLRNTLRLALGRRRAGILQRVIALYGMNNSGESERPESSTQQPDGHLWGPRLI